LIPFVVNMVYFADIQLDPENQETGRCPESENVFSSSEFGEEFMRC